MKIAHRPIYTHKSISFINFARSINLLDGCNRYYGFYCIAVMGIMDDRVNGGVDSAGWISDELSCRLII